MGKALKNYDGERNSKRCPRYGDVEGDRDAPNDMRNKNAERQIPYAKAFDKVRLNELLVTSLYFRSILE